MTVCKQEDDFIDDKTRWVADLSNGERIWQDDFRPGVQPPQAWLRLKDYLKYNNLFIKDLFLQFRSHLEFPLPKNAQGYFFSKACLASAAGNDIVEYYIVGFVDKDKVKTYTYDIPCLTMQENEVRELSRVNPDCLILNRRD